MRGRELDGRGGDEEGFLAPNNETGASRWPASRQMGGVGRRE